MIARAAGAPQARYAAVMAASRSGAASEDENKRKFREALDRKNAKSSSRSDHHKDGGAKQSPAHGPLESRREFRRKSG